MAFTWDLHLPEGRTIVAVRYVKAIRVVDNTLKVYMVDGTVFETTCSEKEMKAIVEDFKSFPNP